MRPRHVVEFRTVSQVFGPLLFLDRASGLSQGELVTVLAPAGDKRSGQVLELSGDRAVIEVLEGTHDLDIESTAVRPSGHAARLGVGRTLLGRVLDGGGRPIDGGPALLPEDLRDVHGAPLNPAAREHPSELIQTGVSAIDGLNTLVRGQKLPIFSGFGLPASRLVAHITRHATVPAAAADSFVVVLAGMGVTTREASYYRAFLESSGVLPRTVAFINRADDPAIERLLTPRLALTAAEYFAFDLGLHVLVLMSDITSYCEALREVATAREEIPARRGYPGYMYTDLASLFERAGRIRGREGSVTQLVVVSMPDDDITHPIPDLAGYITEGQIVLSRDLHRRGVWPPIDILPSLSRLMNAGIGRGKTRPHHRALADQLYACYARGCDLRALLAVVGDDALSDEDRRYLAFATDLEQRFIGQGDELRTVDQTLDLGWQLLARFEDAELGRLPPDTLKELRGRQ
jgi:V/A-type H+-transporting ATPase subunit B